MQQLTKHSDFDVRSVASGGGVVVYERAGRIHLFDPATATSSVLDIQIQTDLPQTRAHYKNARKF
ncbi:MAG: hypothetical protein R2867_44915 [Caldilineaceae bacterium]